MSQLDGQVWLVKSSGRILGPLTKNKVNDLLRSREIVPLDEACLPKRRWQYLRDLKEFSVVLEELRIQQIKSGSEKTQTVGSRFDEITGSVTAAAEDLVYDEITGDVAPINYELTQEIPISNNKSEAKERDVTVTGRVESGVSGKKFVTHESVVEENKSFSHAVWKYTFFALVSLALLFLINKYLVAPKNKKNKNYNEITIANGLYTNGKYKNALKFYKKAFENQTNDNKEPLLRYGTLLIQIERNTSEGIKVLNEALDFDARNKVYVLAGIGLANLFDGDFIFAKKNLEEALSLEPNLTSAIVNLGWIKHREGNLNEAIELYTSAIIKGAGRVDSSPYIYLSKALIEKWKKTNIEKHLLEAKNNLLTIVDDKTDYRQEALFLLTYINLILGKNEQYFSTLERLLDTDPNLTDDHAHDLNVFHDGISWKSFSQLCEEIYKKNYEDSTAIALSGYCALKAQNIKIAEQRFTELANKRTKDPLLLAINAYFYQSIGNESHAAITLGKAIEENKKGRRYSLPILLEAKTCQDIGDDECALKKWKDLLSKDEKNIQAMTNIVLIEAKGGNLKGLENLIREARLISDNYAPARYAETFLYDVKTK